MSGSHAHEDSTTSITSVRQVDTSNILDLTEASQSSLNAFSNTSNKEPSAQLFQRNKTDLALKSNRSNGNAAKGTRPLAAKNTNSKDSKAEQKRLEGDIKVQYHILMKKMNKEKSAYAPFPDETPPNVYRSKTFVNSTSTS